MDAQTTKLQEVVMSALTHAVPASRARIIASYEVEDRSDARVENIIVVYVNRSGEGFSSTGIESPPKSIGTAFFALHEASAPTPDARWSTSEVTIDAEVITGSDSHLALPSAQTEFSMKNRSISLRTAERCMKLSTLP